jgi:DNA-binding NarL/FixJ family response regulator
MIAAIGISLAAEAHGLLVLTADIALSLALIILSIVVKGARKRPPRAHFACEAVSVLMVLGLMSLDQRLLLAGLLFFPLIPTSGKLPFPARATICAIAFIADTVACFLKGISIDDPIVVICLIPGLAAIVAFTETSLKQFHAAEEGRKLLDGLVEAQKHPVESGSQEQAREARRELRKSIGVHLADAAVQVEASRRLMPGEPAKAGRMIGKAKEAIDGGLADLRETGPVDRSSLSTRPMRLLVALADPDARECLALILGMEDNRVVASQASDSEGLVGACLDDPPDLALVDESLPPEGGLAALERLRSKAPTQKCLLLSALPDPRLKALARTAGAAGVADRGRTLTELPSLIRSLLNDEPTPSSAHASAGCAGAVLPGSGAGQRVNLTSRELQIPSFIAKGFSNEEIADRLFLAEGTVKNRVSEILQKIGSRDRTNAALKARELGLL